LAAITARPVANDDDDGVEEILQAAANKPARGDIARVDQDDRTGRPLDDDITDPSSITPENYSAEPEPRSAEDRERAKEIRAILLQRMPYLRQTPEKLEEMVAERI
jgi:hypothetical protein